MSYYQGDYSGLTRAGRMAGDPGFFSFLGGLAKKAVGFIPGVGPIASTALSAIPSGKGMKMARAAGSKAIAIVRKHPGMTAAAGAGVLAAGAGAEMMMHRGARGGRHQPIRLNKP